LPCSRIQAWLRGVSDSSHAYGSSTSVDASINDVLLAALAIVVAGGELVRGAHAASTEVSKQQP
jgi:hypothetical protein